MKLNFSLTPIVQAMLACASLSSSVYTIAHTPNVQNTNTSDVSTDTPNKQPLKNKNYAEMYQLGEDFFRQYYQHHTSTSHLNKDNTSKGNEINTTAQPTSSEPSSPTENLTFSQNQNLGSAFSTTAPQDAPKQGLSHFFDYLIHPNPLPQCAGQWVVPALNHEYFDPQQKANKDLSSSMSVITANQGYYNPHGKSILEGDVVIEQPGRRVSAQRIELDDSQTIAHAQGKVQLQQDGLMSQSEDVKYHLQQQSAHLQNSFYIYQPRQAHGFAQEITRPNHQQTILKQTSYTSCAPSVRPAWHIEAKEILLNQETGRGVSKNTRLYIKNVPVIAVPYFNFPIDDRRTTGFLTPSFGYTNDGGIQLAMPYYFNLAPNYDLTLTPRYLNGRGLMLEADARYLTDRYGSGRISSGYLPTDQNYNDLNRKSLHFEHLWKINPALTASADYNYVSDRDYFSDLGNTPTSSDSVYQSRRLMINYQSPNITGLNAQLHLQNYQTLDKTIVDANRPYARLPQLLVNYTGGNLFGLHYQLDNDTAYFKKPIRDNSALESSGVRFYNQASISYNHQKAGYYVKPTLALRSLLVAFDRDSKISQGYNEHESVTRSATLPQFTIDTGMTFEKYGDYLQTLKPRLFYAYTPYRNQSDFANFDSTYTTIGYDQLFSPYRFYGHDRIEDNNFTSLGLTYSLYHPNGLEKIKASLGQSYYFSRRKVQLDHNLSESAIYRQRTSGPVLSLSSQIYQNLWLNSNFAWLGNGKNSLNQWGGYYQNQDGRLYQLSYIQRRNVEELGQQSYRQAIGSIIQPIHNNWRVLGHVQYDLHKHATREFLLGLNYESCCWGLSVYARRYYNDLDNISTAKANRAVMAEFSLKGLGGLTGRLSSLLEQRILGYKRPSQSWSSF